MTFLIIIIGIFHAQLSFAQEGPEEIDPTYTGGGDTVYVEPGAVTQNSVEGTYTLLPYKERRKEWGVTAAIGYSSYEPVDYVPNFAAVEFVDIYNSPEVPMIDLEVTVKRNLKFGSLGGQFSVGIYTNQSDAVDVADSSLTMIPIKLGAIFFLDTMGAEPFLVPYGAAGIYTVSYTETTAAGSSFGGTTALGFYVNGGVQMQLDWIDQDAARVAYQESGIQATFAYAEARMQTASIEDKDPDFSGGVSWATGVRVEF